MRECGRSAAVRPDGSDPAWHRGRHQAHVGGFSQLRPLWSSTAARQPALRPRRPRRGELTLKLAHVRRLVHLRAAESVPLQTGWQDRDLSKEDTVGGANHEKVANDGPGSWLAGKARARQRNLRRIAGCLWPNRASGKLRCREMRRMSADHGFPPFLSSTFKAWEDARSGWCSVSWG